MALVERIREFESAARLLEPFDKQLLACCAPNLLVHSSSRPDSLLLRFLAFQIMYCCPHMLEQQCANHAGPRDSFDPAVTFSVMVRYCSVDLKVRLGQFQQAKVADCFFRLGHDCVGRGGGSSQRGYSSGGQGICLHIIIAAKDGASCLALRRSCRAVYFCNSTRR
jgi:hypothetical protein